MRLLFKILAVIVGVLGVALAVGSLFALTAAAFGNAPERADQTSKNIMMFFSASYALTAILGYLIVRQAWKHLRRPDRSTANGVVGFASFILCLWLLRLANRYLFSPKPSGTWGPTLELLGGLGMILAIYLFNRLVLKRIAARAFPAGDPPATPAPSSSA
jgi:hypothetical protein